MVKTKLLGGLGNQMFQYAIGKNLSLKNRSNLYLDLSMLLYRDNSINYTLRDFELNIFNIKYSAERQNLASKVLEKVTLKVKPVKYIKEKDHFFDSTILQLRGNIYLDGFWQNENYFKEIESLIVKEFSFKIPPDERNRHMLKQIQNQNSVSVHFRRGDYLTNPIAEAYHGICNNDYYIKAIEIIKATVTDPFFFIFSDEIERVRKDFVFDQNVTFVDINSKKKNYEDMRLMAACKYNIIANSSFSWWAAWLNRNKEKKIIAPINWFKTIKSNIVPEEWIKI